MTDTVHHRPAPSAGTGSRGPEPFTDPGAHTLPALRALLPAAPPGPITGTALVAALRAAEGAARAEPRELWGFAAMNAEAALNALPGARPSAAELWAVALEYATIAASPGHH
ncbi:hypothetical protein [Kitasatospora sp. NPDC059571]|uniref:hypothetical protein n=1 Tax=Kitasatospora sp. NPDC059571 TaxID=3346871 RepID=UPI003689291D